MRDITLRRNDDTVKSQKVLGTHSSYERSTNSGGAPLYCVPHRRCSVIFKNDRLKTGHCYSNSILRGCRKRALHTLVLCSYERLFFDVHRSKYSRRTTVPLRFLYPYYSTSPKVIFLSEWHPFRVRTRRTGYLLPHTLFSSLAAVHEEGRLN